MLTDTVVAPGTIQSNLTELQLLYWTGHQLRPSATHFNNAFLFTFDTPINAQHFKQAFATAVQQHDALRTTVEVVQGVPQQCVLADPPADLAIIDLSAEPDPADALQRWEQQRVARPFSLDCCLYDSALIKIDCARYAWFLNQHHLITDASSFFIIARTVIEQYECLQQGAASAVRPTPSFASYVAAQHRFANSSRAAKSQHFWQEKRHNKPEPLQFYGRLPHKTAHQVQRWTHNLGPRQTAQLQAIAESVDLGAATPELRQFCLTATLFFSLLHLITINPHMGFITTIHKRSTRATRETVGPLMELCPVSVVLSNDETFTSLMKKVAAEMNQLLLHYRHGASRAASDMAPDAIFTFVQRPSLHLENKLVQQHIVHPGCGSESLGLHVHHLLDDNSYELYLDFHQDVFGPVEREHACQTLLALITALLQNPDAGLTHCAIPWPSSETFPWSLDDVRGNGRSSPSYVPPRTPIERQLQQIWEEVLGQSPIGVHDDFFALGGQSWQAMSFLSKFEQAMGRYVPLSALLSASTIAGLAQQFMQADPPEELIEIQPGAAGATPLFLIPGAAGNPLAMNRIGQHLPAAQPVYTFQMPPFDWGNPPGAQIEALAGYYLAAIQQAQPHGPYYLGGYSAGGIFAYEVAQQLLAEGEAIDFLAIIDMPAPNPAHRYWERLCHSLARLLRLSADREEAMFLLGRDCWSRATYFWRRGLRDRLGRYGRLISHFWQLAHRQKWNHLRRRFRRASQQNQATTASSQPVLRDMDPSSLSDPRARALFTLYDRAARKYLPRPYAGQLTLLRCPLGYGRKEIRSPYSDYGWQKLARQVDTHVINATGHLALVQEPAVATVGQIIQASLPLQKENKE